MQKWEYQVIDIDFVTNPTHYTLNGKRIPIPNLPSGNLSQMEVEYLLLRQVGTEGWELVTVLQRGMFYVKRPIH